MSTFTDKLCSSVHAELESALWLSTCHSKPEISSALQAHVAHLGPFGFKCAVNVRFVDTWDDAFYARKRRKTYSEPLTAASCADRAWTAGLRALHPQGGVLDLPPETRALATHRRRTMAWSAAASGVLGAAWESAMDAARKACPAAASTRTWLLSRLVGASAAGDAGDRGAGEAFSLLKVASATANEMAMAMVGGAAERVMRRAVAKCHEPSFLPGKPEYAGGLHSHIPVDESVKHLQADISAAATLLVDALSWELLLPDLELMGYHGNPFRPLWEVWVQGAWPIGLIDGEFVVFAGFAEKDGASRPLLPMGRPILTVSEDRSADTEQDN